MVSRACCSIGSSVASSSNVTGISAISSAVAIGAPKPKAGSRRFTSAFSVVPRPMITKVMVRETEAAVGLGSSGPRTSGKKAARNKIAA